MRDSSGAVPAPARNPQGRRVANLGAGTAPLLSFLAALILAACGEKPPAPAAPLPPIKVSPDLWKEFSGDKALIEVRTQVEFGPRPSGSSALEKARGHIINTLRGHGWETERQEFKETPVSGRGEIPFTNVIARFPATSGQPASRTTQRIIIGSHYDTKVMNEARFVGANDGGSSTGALLELARVLATAPALAEQLELVFFDGEEAILGFGSAELGPDGLVGSRYYARQLRPRAQQYRFAIVWDMIGDKDLTITLPADSPKHLAAALLTAAEQLGVRRNFGFFGQQILDDHVTIATIARIPAIDIIDFDFPPWHTSGDTLDKLSAASLETVGRVTVKMLLNELGAK